MGVKMSRNKKRNNTILIIIVVLAILVGLFYGFLGGGLGVSLSCKENKIIGFQKIPPPLMSILDTSTKCLVDLKVSKEGNVLCSFEKYEIKGDKGIIPCDKIKEYKGNDVIFIEATFYNLDGKKTGEDLQQSGNFW